MFSYYNIQRKIVSDSQAFVIATEDGICVPHAEIICLNGDAAMFNEKLWHVARKDNCGNYISLALSSCQPLFSNDIQSDLVGTRIRGLIEADSPFMLAGLEVAGKLSGDDSNVIWFAESVWGFVRYPPKLIGAEGIIRSVIVGSQGIHDTEISYVAQFGNQLHTLCPCLFRLL